MTTVVDYGAGNLQSVRNTLEALGAEFEVTNRAEVVASARKLILPGVGHFGQMLRALDELDSVRRWLQQIRRERCCWVSVSDCNVFSKVAKNRRRLEAWAYFQGR